MLRVGIVGFGNIGSKHVRDFINGEYEGAAVTALYDNYLPSLEKAEDIYGEKLEYFSNEDEFFKSNKFEAVIIANLHYDHPKMAIKALENGYHVKVEKPAGVYTKPVRQLCELAEKSDKVFGIVFNQRTNPMYQKIREMIKDGELGELRRVNWIITDECYRTQAYYDSGTWRATWGGEGGGVLINQCCHQLDLFQWMFGMPSRVRGFCYFGKRRNIEVEDEVTAYFEYPNGATGVFIASVSEAAGTNRLEVVGDCGKIVLENNEITFYRLKQSETEYNANLKEQKFDKNGVFEKPIPEKIVVPYEDRPESQHKIIIKDWLSAIEKGTEMLAPGAESINELMISNAIYLSAFEDRWVELPIDEDLFLERLNERIAASKYKTEPRV